MGKSFLNVINSKLDQALDPGNKDLFVPLKGNPDPHEMQMNVLYPKTGSKVAYSGKFKLKIPFLNQYFVIGISLFPLPGGKYSISLWQRGKSAVEQNIITQEQYDKWEEKQQEKND